MKDLLAAEKGTDYEEESKYARDNIIPAMARMRAAADELETITAKEYWPLPTYGELLFSV